MGTLIRGLLAVILEWYDVFCDKFIRICAENNADWPKDISPVLFEDFSLHKDGVIEDDPACKWHALPANGGVRVLPEIIDGALTARDSGADLTAAYLSTDLKVLAGLVRAEVSFLKGYRGGSATIIFTKNITKDRSDISFIVNDGSIHLVFTNTKVQVGLFKDRDFLVLKTFYLKMPLPRDGRKFIIGADINHKKLRIIAPGLIYACISHDRVEELHGPYLTIEPFWKKGQCRSRFHKVIVK
ncbi:hypothetical protein [Novosphingobium fuchskuhlense]|uniref:hypothetical protein n=1 Tax=Novosphingobium fuchskuhlense TaxID=1117702 RepID=UPI000A3EDA28|nr:hypothetical protein [Novosphingobium fuchskuhlense]